MKIEFERHEFEKTRIAHEFERQQIGRETMKRGE